MHPFLFLLLPFIGIFVGFLVTLIGGGGGAIYYIPLLVFLFGLTLKEAVPISLATMIFTSFFGSISHIKHKNVHWRGGLLAVGGALIGTGIGTYISTVAPEAILTRAFGILMFIMIYPMWLEMKGKHAKIDIEEMSREVNILAHPFSHKWNIPLAIFLIGFGSGTAAGLFGVSGVVTLIVGFYLIGVQAKIIVGTSIFILFFKALSGFLWHMSTAHMKWDIVIALGIGTSLGGFLGPAVLSKIDSEKAEFYLERSFVCVIALLGCLFLFKHVPLPCAELIIHVQENKGYATVDIFSPEDGHKIDHHEMVIDKSHRDIIEDVPIGCNVCVKLYKNEKNFNRDPEHPKAEKNINVKKEHQEEILTSHSETDHHKTPNPSNNYHSLVPSHLFTPVPHTGRSAFPFNSRCPLSVTHHS